MAEDRKRCGWGTVLVAVTLFATLLLTVPAGPATAAPAGGRTAAVVRHTPAGGAEAQALVRRLGGTVGRRLGIIDGFAAGPSTR